ncbi:MAG TPA: ABC transporter substrate-binding protein, partial [Thermotogales bacterium]|nr:ABC transporter substrate-binding protein [Thermotogales bacterium]
MRKFYLILSLVFVLMVIPALSFAQEDVPVKVRLRMLVAGDQNMVDFFQYEIAPLFEKMYPNVRVYVIGTGPGPAGSRAIVDKLRIEKESGKDKWDIDVAILHEIGVVWALKEGLLRKFTDFLIA